ncbi:MAG: hypothetical protein A2Y17_13285 [Clostridiales bacterium GWF2_38_85]|nr:MAG: hypothetical protein A2Y17_13285 [Clostridiales bacterium GWF2_38_85]
MKIRLKFFTALLLIFAILAGSSLNAFALTWDGSSSGGTGGGSSAGPNGYAIRTTGDNCLGYRFSVVDKNGNNKVSKVIDVFRNTSYGNMEYSGAYKFTVKYNKKQIINNQNSGFSTSKNTTNCYKEANMGFQTSLPTPDQMGTWQDVTTNLNAVLSNLGVGSINNLVNGDKVIVEPLFDVRLESVYHSVTVSELAIYGKYILGASSNGGSSSTSASWGFISSYTNKIYPNALYTTNGQGLWTAASALSSRATFNTIINNGYGVGIAYTENRPDLGNIKVNYSNPGGSGSASFSAAGKTFTIASGSSYTITGVNVGSYTVTETAPASGYICNGSTTQTATVTVNATATVTFSDKVPVGSIVVKYSNPGGSGSASFSAAGKTFSIASGGSYTISNVAAGSYTVTETSPASGYVCNGSTTQTATVTNGGTATVTFSDKVPVGSILVKYSNPSGSGSATFSAAGKTFTIASGGSYTISNVAVGSYTVTETSPASGYVCNGSTTQTATVTNGGTATVTFSDRLPVGNIIVKYSNPSGSGSASFSAAGKTFSITSGGSYTISNVTAGSYTVTETSPASGYVCNGSTTQTATVTDGNTTTITFSDRLSVGGIKVNYSNPSGSGSASFSAAGKTFSIVSGGSYTISNLAAGSYTVTETSPASGLICNGSTTQTAVVTVGNTTTITFSDRLSVGNIKVVYSNPSGSGSASFSAAGVTFSITSGGSYTVSNVTAGTYTAIETSPASGYVCNGSNMQTAVVTDGNTTTITFSDRLPVGSIKVNYSNTGGSGSASFSAAGKTFSITSGGSYTVSNVTAGTYTVTETSPASGYICNGSTMQTAVVTDGNTTTITFSDRLPVGNIKVNYSNPSGSGSASFSAAGKTFSISSGGSYTVSNVTAGSYTVTETSPASGFVCNGSTTQTAIVTDGNTTTITFSDKASVGDLQICYTNWNNTGTGTFNVTGPSGFNRTINVTANVDYIFSNVTAGSYTVTQTVAPTGCKIYSPSVPTTVTNGYVTTVSIYNPENITLSVTPITPNANYTSGTTVISSFYINNLSQSNIIPTDNVNVSFKYYYAGSWTTLSSQNSVVIPASGNNLVWVKWQVPTVSSSASITVQATVDGSSIGAGSSSGSINTTVGPLLTSITPDTHYEKSAPSGFYVPAPPSNSQANNASWSVWSYSGGTFSKQTFGITLDQCTVALAPDSNSPSAKFANGYWTMKSGYGVSTLLTTLLKSLSGTTMPSTTAYTNAQTANLFVPEYQYSSAFRSYCSLENAGTNRFQLPTNPQATNNGRLHFTPVYFPNGNYIAQGKASDCWTPAGMLTSSNNSNAIKIDGTIYDDWAIGR